MNILSGWETGTRKPTRGVGGVRASYGPEDNRINSLLLARADKIDGLLAEYQEKHPNQITAQVIADFLADKPLTREDKGKDFCRVYAGKARFGLFPEPDRPEPL